MILKLTNNEIPTVINSLDFYSRIWIGQFDEILYNLRWYKSCEALDTGGEQTLRTLLVKMRNNFLPALKQYGFNGSYGIFNPDRDIRAGIAYDMQQEIRYKVAWTRHPEGGNTVDFGRPLWCNDDPCKPPYADCVLKDDDNIEMTLMLEEHQIEVLMDAMQVEELKDNCCFEDMFRLYTSNPEVLADAHRLDAELRHIPDDRVFNKEHGTYKSVMSKLEDLQHKYYDYVIREQKATNEMLTKKPRNIIFLDIDGVLNHEPDEHSHEKTPSGLVGIEQDKMDILKNIVKRNHAYIVLTSSWRNIWTQNKIDWDDVNPDNLYMLRRFEENGLFIADALPNGESWSRAYDIHEWLENHEYKNYVILDDEDFHYQTFGLDKHGHLLGYK